MLGRQAAHTRQLILDAALDCFAASGFRSTSLRTIAKRAGVTPPLINHYFGTKTKLIEAVLAASVENYQQAQTLQWDRPIGDLRFFTEGLHVLFRWLGDHPRILELGQWARLENVSTRPQMTQVLDHVRAQIDHIRQEGGMRTGVDTDVLVILIDASFKGYWDRRATLDAYGIDLDDLDERYSRIAIETLLRGVLQGAHLDHALKLLDAPPLQG